MACPLLGTLLFCHSLAYPVMEEQVPLGGLVWFGLFMFMFMFCLFVCLFMFCSERT